MTYDTVNNNNRLATVGGSSVTHDPAGILTNDTDFTFPPSAGTSLDINVGAPEGPNIPVQVGVGKNASVGTFLTPQGSHGFSLSIPLSPVAGSRVTISPTVGNLCGLATGGG